MLQGQNTFWGRSLKLFLWEKLARFLLIWENGPHFNDRKKWRKLWNYECHHIQEKQSSKLFGSRINKLFKLKYCLKYLFIKAFFLNVLQSIKIKGKFLLEWGIFKTKLGKKRGYFAWGSGLYKAPAKKGFLALCYNQLNKCYHIFKCQIFL